MSFPADGSYFTFRLDPVASLQDIEDKQVAKAAGRLSVNEYVACLTWPVGVPQLPPAYEVANIDLVQQGLPPEAPDEFRESRIIRMGVELLIVAIRSLGLDAIMSRRIARAYESRQKYGPSTPHTLLLQPNACCSIGLPPPPVAAGEYTISAIRAADQEIADIPHWQIRAAERAERLANPPNEGAFQMKLKPNWDAESDSSDFSESDGGSHDAPVCGLGPSEDDVQNSAATDPAAAVDDIADVEDVIHTALNHRADLRDLSPVIVPLSYDLSVLTAPPSPSEFVKELIAIRKIRSDYEERIRRLKDEVRRSDDEYMAEIETRRTKQSPTQPKRPIPASSVPFTNKVCIISEYVAVEGEAQKAVIVAI
ncbi:hypothetical protein FB107DRAFT_271642 [Schizophyllum commune]